MTAADEVAPAAATLRRGRGIPAFVCAAIAALVVIALPFAARHIDGSADEFSSNTMPVLPALGWIVCAGLGGVVITHRVQLWFRVDEGPALAVTYDLLPLLLFLAPVIAVVALVSGHLLLATAGLALTAYHAILVLPRLVANRPPAWASSAPRVELAVANVFVDNPTPDAAAAQLVHCAADVIVIAEATPDFMRRFDAAGGDRSHPHRVRDPEDHSDYAVAIASRQPLGDGSKVLKLGPLRLAVAKADVGGIETTVAALNPMSSFDPDGQAIWKQQMDELQAFIPTVDGPLVIAGDLNSTGFRPQFEELLQHRLTDAIDSLGKAWKPSFTLRAVWPLGALGAFVRLDHALVNEHVCALHVRNMAMCGSDHIPFSITLAVRPPATTRPPA
jgi:endonuclease/exonuclease/phosphatase (EEP) superfamily protein YafD